MQSLQPAHLAKWCDCKTSQINPVPHDSFRDLLMNPGRFLSYPGRIWFRASTPEQMLLSLFVR